jgi:lipoate-protein ligase A
MKVEDLSFSDPGKDVLYDDALLACAEKEQGPEVLRFWESKDVFVVLGRTCDEDNDVRKDICRQDDVRVLRRSSGGGTVVQGPGCLNFSLVLRKDRHPDLASITRSYRYILEKALVALKDCGLDAAFRPICDLVVPDGEKKFSGNAQRRGRTHILHHGTILYAFDLSLIARYLHMPVQMPDYRRGRPHEDFITNVPVDLPRFKHVFAGAWTVPAQAQGPALRGF